MSSRLTSSARRIPASLRSLVNVQYAALLVGILLVAVIVTPSLRRTVSDWWGAVLLAAPLGPPTFLQACSAAVCYHSAAFKFQIHIAIRIIN